jgi:DNA-binding SARP family transcriptional activator
VTGSAARKLVRLDAPARFPVRDVQVRTRLSQASGRLQRAAQELAGATASLSAEFDTATDRASPAVGRLGAPDRDAMAGGTEPEHPILTIHLLGQFKLLRCGREISTAEFGGRQVRLLVQMLLSSRPAAVRKHTLIDALWPEATTNCAANLSILVSRARHALGDPRLIVAHAGGYAFSADDQCWVDAEAFESLVTHGRRSAASGHQSAALYAFRSAVALWQGEPLTEDEDSRWAIAYRRHLCRLRQECLEGAAAVALEAGQLNVALAYAQEASDLDPLSENALVLLMSSLAGLGSPAKAIDRFTQWRQWAASELGLDPSPRVLALFERLLRDGVGGPPLPDDADKAREAIAPASCAERLRGSRAATILDASSDAIWMLDRRWFVVYVNAYGAELLGSRPADVIGEDIRQVLPQVRGLGIVRRAAAAMDDGMPGCFRLYFPPLEIWLDAELHPTGEGLIVVMKRATRQVMAAERILLALGEVLTVADELDDWVADPGPARSGRHVKARIDASTVDAIADATWLDDEVVTARRRA